MVWLQRAGEAVETPVVRLQRAGEAVESPVVHLQRAGELVEAPGREMQRDGGRVEARRIMPMISARPAGFWLANRGTCLQGEVSGPVGREFDLDLGDSQPLGDLPLRLEKEVLFPLLNEGDLRHGKPGFPGQILPRHLLPFSLFLNHHTDPLEQDQRLLMKCVVVVPKALAWWTARGYDPTLTREAAKKPSDL